MENKRGIVLINVGYPDDPKFSQITLAENITTIENVRGVFLITGAFDIAVLVATEDMRGVSETIQRIRAMPGVQKTETAMVLNSLKTEWFGLARRESSEI